VPIADCISRKLPLSFLFIGQRSRSEPHVRMAAASRASVRSRTRIALACAAIGLCSSVIVAVFWVQDLRYSLPTPRPSGLREPDPRVRVALPAALSSLAQAGNPFFLHFYRPGCPCSRFNLEHVRSLERQHGTDAQFVLVLEGQDPGALDRAFARMDWPVAHIDDVDGEIAAALGVYSTPQAAIIDCAGCLAFRGNYNSARYCSDRRTEFARLALEDVLGGRRVRALPPEATIAYGCSLPANLEQKSP
jgi:hypothetical protein